MTVKYSNIKEVVGDVVEFASPVKYLKAGMTILNMQSGVYTTIKSVISDLKIELTSGTGFTDGTSAQIEIGDFDGEILARFLPRWQVTEDLQDFLDIFSSELNSQWEAIGEITNNIDPFLCRADLLPTLAASYGIPLDAELEEEVQRNFIKGAQYAYRHKGSKIGLIAAFRSIGYDLVIHEYFTGKYVNVINTVTDNLDGTYDITLNVGTLKVPSTLGQFRVADMLSESTGAGSNTAVNNPGNWAEIIRINSPSSFVVDNLNGTGFTPGMNVVVFARNPDDRVAVNADYDDTDVNEFPLMSSFIKGEITNRRPGSELLTPERLEQLKSFLKLFVSSHARLAGVGIEQQILFWADFREEESEFPEPPEAQIPYNPNAVTFTGQWDPTSGNPPSATPSAGEYWFVSKDGTYNLSGITDWKKGQWVVFADPDWEQIQVPIGKFEVILLIENTPVNLDDDHLLDETTLDEIKFLETELIINYNQESTSNSESLSLSENWTVVTV